jgi:hypothetical protein
MVDVHDPDAERIVLVMAPLNTPSPASLDAAFPAAEAKRLADNLELHAMPKPGRGVNLAEIALRVRQRPCLERRLGDRATRERDVAAWEAPRNTAPTTIEWRCTTHHARIKLRRLYPVIHA